jgi:exodeoxyribonuclease V alpha subunit
VYNGELGFVRAVDPEAGEVLVEFDGREVAYGFGELDELVLAYSTTIHKSQGSEYPAVVIPLTTQHYPMLRRNLLYTGVTWGQAARGDCRLAQGSRNRRSRRPVAQALVEA